MSSEAKTILITGATSGIGRHAALHLAKAGHRVLASGRNAKLLAELELEGDGRIESVSLDVTSQASINAAVIRVDALTNERGLDVLINNAGYGVLGPTEMISDQDFRAQYDTNVFGLMAVTRAFLPKMRERGAGRIINLSSLGGIYTLPLFGVYNSTKYAVESLSDALRMELAPFGILVSLIEPGTINTGFSDRSMSVVAKYQDPHSPYAAILARAEEMRQIADRIATGPECVSRAIATAVTAGRPRARYVAPRRVGWMIGLLRALPTRWSDVLVSTTMGLTRRRMAAPKLLEARRA